MSSAVKELVWWWWWWFRIALVPNFSAKFGAKVFILKVRNP